MTSNIHTAINAVMQSVGYVQKQKAQGLSYTYAGESALIEALRPSMVANEIYMHVAEIKGMEREQYTTAKGTQMINTVLTGIVRFIHAPSGTSIDVWATGEGSDAGDKSANKAMTGMYKYAIRNTFMIETGDDPDKNASEERVTTEKAKELTEAQKKQYMLDTYSKLFARAKGVKLTLPPIKPDMTIDAMKAQYAEQKKFVEQAEEQAKAGE